jgi:hypothetical protein
MALNTTGSQSRPAVFCYDCGFVISDLQDVNYAVLSDGTYATFHTSDAHRELGIDPWSTHYWPEIGPFCLHCGLNEYAAERIACDKRLLRPVPQS